MLDEGRIVFDGTKTQPTIEGPKLYKRNGYYYIFAPADGVKHGWQTVLRSRNIYGPYGRVVHLQPLTWLEDDWCIIGIDQNGDGIGEPVLEYEKPSTSIGLMKKEDGIWLVQLLGEISENVVEKLWERKK